jgi:hypothetical protein
MVDTPPQKLRIARSDDDDYHTNHQSMGTISMSFILAMVLSLSGDGVVGWA